jgi:hypothetical protein
MAKSPRKAEAAIPVSDELIPIAMKASPDAGGEGSDVQPAAAEAPFNALRLMEGNAGAELHAVYVRLAEMLPFLHAAVAQAEGELQGFLADLLADLTRGASNAGR